MTGFALRKDQCPKVGCPNKPPYVKVRLSRHDVNALGIGMEGANEYEASAKTLGNRELVKHSRPRKSTTRCVCLIIRFHTY